MTGQIIVALASYILVVNVLAYGAMVIDKAKAANGVRRIPEATLLNLAMIGGSVGTVIAQQTIRHKTRKEPFRSQLTGIVLFQVVALVALAVAIAVTGSPEALWRLLAS